MRDFSRRKFIGTGCTSLLLSLGGCLGEESPGASDSPTTSSPTSSPAPRGSPTDTVHPDPPTEETATANEDDTETDTTDKPTETEGESTSTSTEPHETSTSDCNQPDIWVRNTTSDTIDISIKLFEHDDQSTATDPHFADSRQIAANESYTYYDVPPGEGRYRLEARVRDGPSNSKLIEASDWEGSSSIRVTVESDYIGFGQAHTLCPTSTSSS